MCSFYFFFARSTDPPSREGGRWETKHFRGMALLSYGILSVLLFTLSSFPSPQSFKQFVYKTMFTTVVNTYEVERSCTWTSVNYDLSLSQVEVTVPITPGGTPDFK